MSTWLRLIDSYRVIWTAIAVGLLAFFSITSEAARLKDVATVKGVRENILIGYGIVVGLNGTGDGGGVTGQSLARLFEKLGLDLQNNANPGNSKNAAAVIVTAKLPPFARVGAKIDVTVSSIGDAESLQGGILLVTPLRAGDQNVYAVAQGPVSLGGLATGETGYPTVGRVVAGATIEKDVDTEFEKKKSFRLALNLPDFTTAARVVALINAELGGKYASARDSGTIDVIVPFNYEDRTVELMAILENVKVNIDNRAKIVLNERTGTVVMGAQVSISPVAISHGDLSIEVKDQAAATAAAGGAAANPQGQEGRRNKVAEVPRATTVKDLVRVLNGLGVSPKDLTAIFQTLRKTGALQADLELM
jgi:flagellar P-ring protein precursor FlgI